MAQQLNFNDKQENNGTNARGRLTAAEFNQVVNAVNDHTTQLGQFSFTSVNSEAEYEQLPDKEENTVYLIFEEE